MRPHDCEVSTQSRSTRDAPAFLRGVPAQRGTSSSARREIRKDDDEQGGHVPGEPALWLFILGDLTLFGAFFVGYLVAKVREPVEFRSDASDLVKAAGLVNTLVLLATSLLIVRALSAFRAAHLKRARSLILCVLLGAAVFAAIKIGEYVHAGLDGRDPASSVFFTYYFVLTGIHLFHLTVGVVLLVVLWFRLRDAGRPTSTPFAEGVAVYWHMVDLLWLVLFSLFYLGQS